MSHDYDSLMGKKYIYNLSKKCNYKMFKVCQNMLTI